MPGLSNSWSGKGTQSSKAHSSPRLMESSRYHRTGSIHKGWIHWESSWNRWPGKFFFPHWAWYFLLSPRDTQQLGDTGQGFYTKSGWDKQVSSSQGQDSPHPMRAIQVSRGYWWWGPAITLAAMRVLCGPWLLSSNLGAWGEAPFPRRIPRGTSRGPQRCQINSANQNHTVKHLKMSSLEPQPTKVGQDLCDNCKQGDCLLK